MPDVKGRFDILSLIACVNSELLRLMDPYYDEEKYVPFEYSEIEGFYRTNKPDEYLKIEKNKYVKGKGSYLFSLYENIQVCHEYDEYDVTIKKGSSKGKIKLEIRSPKMICDSYKTDYILKRGEIVKQSCFYVSEENGFSIKASLEDDREIKEDEELKLLMDKDKKFYKYDINNVLHGKGVDINNFTPKFKREIVQVLYNEDYYYIAVARKNKKQVIRVIKISSDNDPVIERICQKSKESLIENITEAETEEVEYLKFEDDNSMVVINLKEFFKGVENDENYKVLEYDEYFWT